MIRPPPRPTLFPYPPLFRSLHGLPGLGGPRRHGRDERGGHDGLGLDLRPPRPTHPAGHLLLPARRLADLPALRLECAVAASMGDRKSTRLNSSHLVISYAVF